MTNGGKLTRMERTGMPAALVEWLAAAVLIPMVFPIVTKIGIQPVYFDIGRTAAVGKRVVHASVERFADISPARHGTYPVNSIRIVALESLSARTCG